MTDLLSVLGSLLLLVAIGAIIPVLPTGPSVAAAAAYASHRQALAVPLVILAGGLGAYSGDLVLYLVCRWGGERLVRRLPWLKYSDRGAALMERVQHHEVLVLLVSRMLPAGRIPVLVAGAVAGVSWRRFALVNIPACLLWASIYTVIGLGGAAIFARPWQAILAAVVGASALALITRLVRRTDPVESPRSV